MDTPEQPKAKPLRVVPKDRMKRKPPGMADKSNEKKQLDYVISPIPHDPTKGKLDMQGAFRFNKPVEGMDWAKEVWSNPNNTMKAYVYREMPVCNFEQSNDEPNPELGHNISKWDTWPFGDNDWQIGMLERFGGGTYMVLFIDTLAGRKIAKIENWEFPNWPIYPPKIRVDDVVLDSLKNKPFIAWARNAGCLFPNDRGYEKGKFVHIETQRHRNVESEEDPFMTKGPIGDAVAGFVGDVLKERLQPQVSPVNPAESSLNTMAAKAAIEMVNATHNEVLRQKHDDQSALLGLVGRFVDRQFEPKSDDGFRFAIESLKAMSEAQVALLQADRVALTARLDRLEAMNMRLMQQPPAQAQQTTAIALDPQTQMLDWLDKQEQIMTRLGYSRRGQRAETAAEPEKSMLETITSALGPIVQQGMQMYTQHMQYTMRMTELSIMQRGGVPPPQMPIPPAPHPQPPHQPSQPSQPSQPQPQQGPEAGNGNTVNEEARQEIGGEFDNYVINFHPELEKIDKVICSKFIEGMQVIIQKQAQSLEEQIDIMADHGAMLADWYLEIPNNMHNVLIGFQDILIPVLKTYRPIWSVLRTAPASMHTAFIDGFCHPERLDDEEEETKTDDPEIITN